MTPEAAAIRALLGAALIGCTATEPVFADDQSRPASAFEETIGRIRGVHGVFTSECRNPRKGCVLHLLDMHYISSERFVAWAKSRGAEAANRDRAAIGAQYEWMSREIQALQLAHESIVSNIIARVGTQVIYVEGLPADDVATKEFLIAVRGGERHLLDVARTIPRVREFVKQFEAAKPRTLSSTDYFKLRCGAAASLFLAGKVIAIEPVEELDAYNVNAWLLQKGVYSIVAREAREDAIVSTLLKAQMPAIIVLGGAHNLADNLIRLSTDACDYVRIESDAYHALYRKIWERGWLEPTEVKQRRKAPRSRRGQTDASSQEDVRPTEEKKGHSTFHSGLNSRRYDSPPTRRNNNARQ